MLNNQPQGGLPMDDDAVASGWEDDGLGYVFQPNSNSRLTIRAGAAASTIIRCNGACGKTRHAAHRPHGRPGSFCQQHFLAQAALATYINVLAYIHKSLRTFRDKKQQCFV